MVAPGHRRIWEGEGDERGESGRARVRRGSIASYPSEGNAGWLTRTPSGGHGGWMCATTSVSYRERDDPHWAGPVHSSGWAKVKERFFLFLICIFSDVLHFI